VASAVATQHFGYIAPLRARRGAFCPASSRLLRGDALPGALFAVAGGPYSSCYSLKCEWTASD